jgi:16S rRNA (guanine966-N2)-methyltransferase
MRVVSGSRRGRKLLAVPGSGTRPILDRVKTALFDILRPELENKTVLDMFAGTGQIGIEALSQGARSCIFLDTSALAIDTIKKNLANTDLSELSEVRHTDAFTYIRGTRKAFDLIIIAPPQYKGMWIDAMHALAERPDLVAKNGLILVQIDPREYEPLTLEAFEEEQQRKYGATLLVFYRKKGESAG